MERTPMEKALSTDVVMDIVLSHLNLEDLLDSRYVSTFWNKAASSVLRKRSTMMKHHNIQTLMEIGKRIQSNPDFPFSGLQFAEPWKMTTAGAIKFAENYGERFTSLRLDTRLTIRLQDMAPFIHRLPRLTILELHLSPARRPSAKALDPANSQVLDLSSVRTIRISPSSCKPNEDVVESNKDLLCEIFKAASSSELRIECLDATYKILRVLESAGKLQAVSVLNVSKEKNQNFDDLRVDHWLSNQTPALTKLDFNDAGCISREGLMTLLISSQRTLKYLHLHGLRPSELSSECPVLSKLTTLSLNIYKSDEYVFKGRKGHKFPALKELKLGVLRTDIMSEFIGPKIANMSDGLFIVPSLKRIHLHCHVKKTGMEDLARSFPNVIEIQLNESDFSDLTEIWSVQAFKFLEKLVILDYLVRPPFDHKKDHKNMDSLLTGIPIGICENLRKHNQAIFTDPPFHEILRDRPSILQLKNLKELIVYVRLEDRLKKLPEEPPFISMVSVWYALQMMPNLQWKFVYEDRWVKSHTEDKDKDKAVKRLKAAFKHVQPYVELEPFFY